MTRCFVALAALAAALATSACQSMGGVAETPAYVSHPTPEGRSAIEQAVSHALHVAHVDLPEDVGANDGLVVVQRNQLGPPMRLQPYGRDPSDPVGDERFHLIKAGDHCLLVHDRTGRQYDVIGAVCQPR